MRMRTARKSAITCDVLQGRSAVHFLQASSHKARKHRHHHLRFDLHKVVGQGVHLGADFSRHGDGVSASGRHRYGEGCRWRDKRQFGVRCVSGLFMRNRRGTYFALFSLSSEVMSPLFTISYLMALGMMVSIRSITGKLVLIDLSYIDELHIVVGSFYKHCIFHMNHYEDIMYDRGSQNVWS